MLANGFSDGCHMVVRFTSTLYLCTLIIHWIAFPWIQQLMPNFVLPYCIGLKYTSIPAKLKGEFSVTHIEHTIWKYASVHIID